MSAPEELESLLQSGLVPPQYAKGLKDFYISYEQAIRDKKADFSAFSPLFHQFFRLLKEQFKNPYQFSPYHERISSPFDYYTFAKDFLRPLIDLKNSKRLGLDLIPKMQEQLDQGHNIILFANHQTEPDPIAISLLLEDSNPEFADKIIYVAGDRVISDPLAIPFSMGCNLFCIYSKRHIDHPPEKKEEKLQHNRRTLSLMGEMLAEGGKCITVFPSGGRDRKNAKGEIEVALFDPKSLDMFSLITKQAKRETHFYPLTLATYSLLPPPDSVSSEMGEDRSTQYSPIHLAFSEELNFDTLNLNQLSKAEQREARSSYIWTQVKEQYEKLSKK